MKRAVGLLIFGLFLRTHAIADDTKPPRKPAQNGGAIELTQDASKLVGNFLRSESKKKNKLVKFDGGPQVTIYSVGNLTCYFQNSEDSVSCTATN